MNSVEFRRRTLPRALRFALPIALAGLAAWAPHAGAATLLLQATNVQLCEAAGGNPLTCNPVAGFQATVSFDESAAQWTSSGVSSVNLADPARTLTSSNAQFSAASADVALQTPYTAGFLGQNPYAGFTGQSSFAFYSRTWVDFQNATADLGSETALLRGARRFEDGTGLPYGLYEYAFGLQGQGSGLAGVGSVVPLTGADLLAYAGSGRQFSFNEAWVRRNYLEDGSSEELGSGQIFGTFTVLGPVAPVPEPHEWVMLLAGLGVVGVAARRRTLQRSLGASPGAMPDSRKHQSFHGVMYSGT